MWDDPLFNPRVEIDLKVVTDSEFVELRRRARLIALETLYIRIASLEKRVLEWEEVAGRHAWGTRQLLERAKVPLEILEAINIEQQVNMMDPDFSFADWLKTYADQKSAAD